jgi:hypothetical protein
MAVQWYQFCFVVAYQLNIRDTPPAELGIVKGDTKPRSVAWAYPFVQCYMNFLHVNGMSGMQKSHVMLQKMLATFGRHFI